MVNKKSIKKKSSSSKKDIKIKPKIKKKAVKEKKGKINKLVKKKKNNKDAEIDNVTDSAKKISGIQEANDGEKSGWWSK